MALTKAIFSRAPIQRDVGLLLLRVGVGLSMLLFHGWGKLTGGPERWERIGASMGNLGITFAPQVWGFLAAAAESLGSALLIVGILFRPAAVVLAFTMLVAIVRHLSLPAGQEAAGWEGASHALEFFTVFIALLFMGPGKLVFGGLDSRE